MKTVILTGPKHSGKTSAGRVLASLCSCEFIDIDDLILQRTGKSPRQLYSEGQTVFQKAEAEAMAAITDEVGGEGQRVIAAGGGIIDNEEAAAILKKAGATVVYLDISTECAWDRIAKSGELPPFLRTDNPRETHRVLHERRAAAYSRIADIVIEAGVKTPREIAEEILDHLD